MTRPYALTPNARTPTVVVALVSTGSSTCLVDLAVGRDQGVWLFAGWGHVAQEQRRCVHVTTQPRL